MNIGGGVYGSALHIAAMKGQIYLIKDLCSASEDLHLNINQTDSDGNTVLHYIMMVFQRDPANSAIICETLIEAGAEVNLKNATGWSPLHLAVRKSQYAAVKFAAEFNEKKQEQCSHTFDFNLTGGNHH